MSEGKLHKFYNSTAWKKTRNLILLKHNFLCSKCGAPADTVHHITELNIKNVDDPAIALGESNLIVLCRACHNEEHNRFMESAPEVPNRIIKFNKDGTIATVIDEKNINQRTK